MPESFTDEWQNGGRMPLFYDTTLLPLKKKHDISRLIFMKKTTLVPFSSSLTKETKILLEKFAKSRGLKINHLVEKAILEYIEDEMDKSIIEARSTEETVEWKKRA